jgi:hypothetical protein
MSVPPHESVDSGQARFDYGHGGIPWPLMLLYLAFLVFFTWYTLEYQLPDYLDQGPGQRDAAAVEPGE